MGDFAFEGQRGRWFYWAQCWQTLLAHHTTSGLRAISNQAPGNLHKRAIKKAMV